MQQFANNSSKHVNFVDLDPV